MVNVDKYTIHGSYGIRLAFQAVSFSYAPPTKQIWNLKQKHDGWRLEEEFPVDPTIQRTFWCCLPCLPLFVFKFFRFRVSQKTTKIHHRTRGLEIKNTKHHLRFWHMIPKKPPGNSKRNYIWVFPKIWVPPKSSILIGFSIIKYYKPFILGFPYFWKHPYTTSPPKENACTSLFLPFGTFRESVSIPRSGGTFFLVGRISLQQKHGGFFIDLGSMDSHMWSKFIPGVGPTWDTTSKIILFKEIISDIQSKRDFRLERRHETIWNFIVSLSIQHIDSTLATYTLSTFLILLFQCKFTML